MTGGLTAARLRASDCRVAPSGARPATRVSGQALERTAAGAGAAPGHDAGEADIVRVVRYAAMGDTWAWERLVGQYNRLIWSITREFTLLESEAADVVQVTWLRLLEHIHRIEHPARVGSWLAVTARHECIRAVEARRRVSPHDDAALDEVAALQPEVDERILMQERVQEVRAALSRLPRQWQQLLELLMADPPASYAEISDQLGLPVGSIGPTRGRCLAKLRVLLQTP